MSFTREMEPDAAEEIATLEGMIQNVSSKSLKSVLEGLLSVIKKWPSFDAVQVLRKFISCYPKPKVITKLNAGEMEIETIMELFNLEMSQNDWTLAESSLVPDVPKRLKENLDDLEVAWYGNSEACCRVAIDIILVQCRKYQHVQLTNAQSSETNVADAQSSKTNVADAQSSKTNVADPTSPSTPQKAIVDVGSLKRVKLLPESSLSVEIDHKGVLNGSISVTGRADWALGYRPVSSLGYHTIGVEGSLLIAIEAKQESKFSEGRAQLIAYLAILRENRKRARKTNTVTQGFYSDGTWFAFVCIKSDGTIEESSHFDIRKERDLKIVFSFIVTMIDTAMKSTPNATPTKPGDQREREINEFETEVWDPVFVKIQEVARICEEEDARMEGAM